MSLTRVDTFEIQQIILWVNLAELQVQFDHHSRIGMNVTIHNMGWDRDSRILPYMYTISREIKFDIAWKEKGSLNRADTMYLYSN